MEGGDKLKAFRDNEIMTLVEEVGFIEVMPYELVIITLCDYFLFCQEEGFGLP